MATSYSATMQLEYEDGETRSVTFNDVTLAGLQNFKPNVLALNETIADETAGAPYKETFVSSEGSPVKRIRTAKYTATEETVIYNG